MHIWNSGSVFGCATPFMFWDKWCHEAIKSYRKAHLKFRKCFCMCNSVFVWDTKASYARYCLGSQRISTIYCLKVLYLFWKKNCNDSHLMVSLDLIVCGSHDTFLLNHSQRCMKSCLKMMINIKFMMAKVPSLLHPHPKFLLIHLLFSPSGSVMSMACMSPSVDCKFYKRKLDIS